ncbi:hypothetical protein ACIA3K_09715 [Micromonospora sp. NPDC051543]|uniref:hypothetical protein n=1 Tax=Micromonospora sp. NPDC051543 TaxID=3364287 RepID=UPI0037992BCA
MNRLSRIDARMVAAVAAPGALALLILLVVLRRQDLVGVVLALLCVLLATVATVAVSAARQRDEPEPAEQPHPTALPDLMPYGIDADTLDALDSRDALRAVRERGRARGGFSDR